MRPHGWQPTRLCRPWDSPGKNTRLSCHFLLQCVKVKSESEVAQSYPTLSDSMDCSLPGSSVHGIFQARVLEWGAIAFSNSSSGTLQIRFSLMSQKMQKIIREMGFREAIKMVMWKTAHQPLTSTLDLAWARNQPIFIRLGHWVCLLQLLWLVSLDYHNKVQ